MVENEGFNVLRQRYSHDRNFGHASENSATVLLVLDLLACAMQTARDPAEKAWQVARRATGSRDWIFRQLHVLAARIVFQSLASLLDVAAAEVEIPP